VFEHRVLSVPVVYPANYGPVPSSKGADDDPLDGLVLAPGARIMLDDGEIGDKIIAAPASDVDPACDEIGSIDDLPAMERGLIQASRQAQGQ
jgi:inorganic pyrophosphatase